MATLTNKKILPNKEFKLFLEDEEIELRTFFLKEDFQRITRLKIFHGMAVDHRLDELINREINQFKIFNKERDQNVYKNMVKYPLFHYILYKGTHLFGITNYDLFNFLKHSKSNILIKSMDELLERAIVNMNWIPDKTNEDNVEYDFINQDKNITIDDCFPILPKKKNLETTKSYYMPRRNQTGSHLIHTFKLRVIPLFMIPYIWCELKVDWAIELDTLYTDMENYFCKEQLDNTLFLDTFLQFESNFQSIRKRNSPLTNFSIRKQYRYEKKLRTDIKRKLKEKNSRLKEENKTLKAKVVKLKDVIKKQERKLKKKIDQLEKFKKEEEQQQNY
jgi:hypothetical protein